jgi:uncharacterized protein
MKIDILKLRERPFVYDIQFSPQYLSEGTQQQDGLTFNPGVGRVTFKMVGNDILAEGELFTRVHGRCGRCLTETSFDVRTPVHLYYWPEKEDTGSKILDIDPDEPDYGVYSGDTLDPDEELRELLVVEVPLVVLCKPECRGLCPTCGQDLNVGSCECAPPEAATRTEPEWKQQLKSLRQGKS